MTDAQPIRSMVVDDEPVARDLLMELLQSIDGVEVVGAYGQSSRAVAAIRREVPDLVFLDIQMRGKSGFDVIEELGAEAPLVVLVTAYDEYALRGFEVNAVDYLLKPVSRKVLVRAVARVRERLFAGTDAKPPAFQAPGADALRYFPVRIGEQVSLVPVGSISHFEAAGKYVKVHFAGAEHTVRMTMKAVEAVLDPAVFVRVSRAAIVNIDQIRFFEPWGRGEWMITLRSGSRVLSTQGFRTRFQHLLRAP